MPVPVPVLAWRVGATISTRSRRGSHSLDRAARAGRSQVLIDGARALASMGSRVIKVALFDPKGEYPFNSPQWPKDGAFPTLLSMAQHAYYRELWAMPQFDTYVLIAYSTVGGGYLPSLPFIACYTQPDPTCRCRGSLALPQSAEQDGSARARARARAVLQRANRAALAE